MIIDDRIIKDYLSGNKTETYKDCWIFKSFGNETMFELPDDKHKEKVRKLYDSIKKQLSNFKPRNNALLKMLFPNFNEVATSYTIILVVGFPDPYDAMVLEHNGKEYMVFDLIQFGGEDAICQLLTHELIHLCLHKYYLVPNNSSYIENLNYTTFDEGFAHALSYTEDILSFTFDDFHVEKFHRAKKSLELAIKETDPIKQALYFRSSDTGAYWDKFASISGKLYILKNLNIIENIYHNGWSDFVYSIISLS